MGGVHRSRSNSCGHRRFNAGVNWAPAVRASVYVGSAIFALAVSVVGFLPGIVDPSRRNGPTSLLVVVHGLSGSGGWRSI